MRQFFRRHPKVAGLLLGLVALLVCVAVLVAWEIGRECVRWSTRINVTQHGGVYTTKVCAETRARWGENVGK